VVAQNVTQKQKQTADADGTQQGVGAGSAGAPETLSAGAVGPGAWSGYT
jgi:hypothetical protein